MKQKPTITAYEMVETQLISRGLTDPTVIKVMLKVPRELFVPDEYIKQAYEDHPLPIGEGQTISQPYMVALMTKLLSLTGNEVVLEIGTGSGYQTAIIAELAHKVYTIERIKLLQEKAKQVLDSLGYTNIFYKTGDGSCGWKEFAPYDRIIVTAGSANIPQPLLDQLNTGGKLVIPIGDRYSQILTVIEKTATGVTKTEICECVFVPLIGKYGWQK